MPFLNAVFFRSALIRTCRILIHDCFTWPRYLMLLCEAFLCSELREELQCLGPSWTLQRWSRICLEFVFNLKPAIFRCLLKGFWDVLPLATLQKAGVEVSKLTKCESELRSHESLTKCRLAICLCCSWAAIALSLPCTEYRLNKSDR